MQQRTQFPLRDCQAGVRTNPIAPVERHAFPQDCRVPAKGYNPYLGGFMRAPLLCAIFLSTATGLLAQGNGTIHGVVTDPSGLAVPGAAVTASLDERGATRSVTTGAQGDFVLPLLSVGTWSLRVEGKGFKQFSRHGLGLTSNQNVRVDATL